MFQIEEKSDQRSKRTMAFHAEREEAGGTLWSAAAFSRFLKSGAK
jgi:hypothetical protein